MKSLSKLIVITIMLIASSLQIMLQERDYVSDKDSCLKDESELIISSPTSQNQLINSNFLLSSVNLEEDDVKSEFFAKKITDIHFYNVLILALLYNEDKQDKELQNPFLFVEFNPLKLYDFYCNWQLDIC